MLRNSTGRSIVNLSFDHESKLYKLKSALLAQGLLIDHELPVAYQSLPYLSSEKVTKWKNNLRNIPAHGFRHM